MKTKIFLFAFLLSVNFLGAQSFARLDINHLIVPFNAAGDMLYRNPSVYTIVPSQSIGWSYGNLWIGGFDQNGQLHVAAQTYRQTGTDFWAGPMDTTTASCSSAQNTFYNKVWKINKTTIDSFRLGQFAVVPSSITSWPGNGNSAAGEGHHLAPYVDVNADGNYNYLDGDYPQIRGDQALFFVYNDSLVGQSHGETGGKRLGLEIRCLAYAVACDDSALANTVFMHYEIINRSSNTYDSTIVGLWNDIDISNYIDDKVGCDSLQNDFYFYDSTFAFGAVFLNRSMSGVIAYNNDFTAMGNPENKYDYYGYLKNIFKDSIPLTYGGNGYGGSVPTNFIYTGNPFSGAGWLDNFPADERILGSTSPFTFAPNQHYTIDMAYVAAYDPTLSTYLCVPTLKQRMQAIKTYYNNDQTPCSDNISSIPQNSNLGNSISIFPNPATSQITIHTTSEKPQTYSIFNLTGQQLITGMTSGRETLIDINTLSAGMYFIRIGTNELQQTLPLIKTQ